MISRPASSPLSSGIIRSRTTTSGLWACASRTASCPLAASATTCSPSRSSSRRSPCRTIEWSSARTIRSGISSLQRGGRVQLRACVGRRRDRERAADRLETIPDHGETEAEVVTLVVRIDSEADADIAQRAAEPLVLAPEPDRDARHQGVLGDVVQRYLHEAV